MSDLAADLQAALGEDWTVEHRLGAGATAFVFRARDARHHRAVAIKVLRPELASTVAAERFLREIRIAAPITHPHILPVYDSGAAGGLLYYVMPYIDGESLRDRLAREGQLPVGDAVRVTQQIAGALAHAHRHGIVHRDIKPENILLNGGDALLADFGVARAIEAAGGTTITESGLAVGTASYMSPEQASADQQIDGRSDIYGLACVLYEMLAGHPPFLGTTVQEVIARHHLDPVPRVAAARPAVSPAIDRAITRALAKAPADRYATAADFAAALDAPDDVEAAPASPRRRAHRAWVAGAGMAAIALAGVLAARAFRQARVHAAPRSVAVLYFDDQSPDRADAFLADGLTEELILRLGELSRLTVKSRFAVRRFQGAAAADPAAVGRALGVAALVTGSVRRSRHRLRVTVELVNASTGVREWGAEYDRTDADLLNLETDVASAIATALAGRLDPAERATLARRPTANPEAYTHFLRGEYFLAQRKPSATEAAMAEYETAVHLDSAFARAWARDAFCYSLFLAWSWPHPTLGPDSVLARGVRATRIALALDSTSSDAWMTFGMQQWFLHPRTWRGAVPAMTRAIVLDSTNAEALNLLGVTLLYLNRNADASAAFHRALAIDPARPISLMWLGLTALSERRPGEARRYLDSALAVNPGFVEGLLNRAEYRLAERDAAGARADVVAAFRVAPEELYLHDPVPLALLAEAAAQQGDTAAARRWADSVRAGLPRADSLDANGATYYAIALLSAGDRARALGVLGRARPRGPMLWWNLRMPDFDPLRGDPRFPRIAAPVVR